MNNFKMLAVVAMSIWCGIPWDNETILKLVVIYGESGKDFSREKITKLLALEGENELLDFDVEVVDFEDDLEELIWSVIAEHNESLS